MSFDSRVFVISS